MQKLPLLFDISPFHRRKSLDQVKFEEANQELLRAFSSLVPKALVTTQEIMSQIKPSYQNRNLPATLMSGYLTGFLRETFPIESSLDQNGRYRLITKTSVCYVKKLDDNLKPSNVETLSTVVIMNQRTFSDADLSTNIFLGYTTPDFSAITGIYAVCINGEAINWYSDLSSMSSPATDAVPPTTVPPQIKPQIAIKKKGE